MKFTAGKMHPRKKPINLLLFTRSPSTQAALHQLSGFRIRVVNSVEEICLLLDSKKIDILVCDFQPNAIDNLSFFSQVTSLKRHKHLAIILLLDNPHYDITFINSALESGITMLLYAPYSIAQLQTTLLVAHQHKETTKHLRKVLSSFKKQAETDPLTHLYNRTVLYNQGPKEIAKAQRGHLPLSLLIIDIDHFKDINDRHGHLVGDEVLVALSELLVCSLRSYDIVVRFGGEEFVILLPNTTLEQAHIVSEKLRQVISTQPLMTAKGVLPPITVSIGVSCLSDSTVELDQLLKRIDEALYVAKAQGRNRVIVAKPQ